MAVTLVNVGTITDDLVGAAAFTVTAGAHLVDDIIVVALWNEGGSKPTLANPVGVAAWNEITTGAGTADATWYWGRATTTGTVSGDVSAADTDCFGVAYVIRGCWKNGTPYEDATTSGDGTNTDTTPDTATVTTTGANRLVIAFLAHGDDIAFASGNPPAGWTDATTDVSTADGTDAGFQTIGKYVAAAGDATTVVIGTWSAGEAYWCLTAAFIPEVSPTVALNTPSDTATGVSTTPDLVFTGTDANADAIEYNVQVDTVSTFDSTVRQPYNTGSGATSDPIYGFTGGAHEAKAQSFVAGVGNITSIDLKLSKTLSPADNLSIKLTSSLGGSAIATSASIGCSTLTTSAAVYNFTFSPSVALTQGNTYYIEIYRSGTRDTNNCPNIFKEPSYSGGAGYTSTGGLGFTDEGTDFYFQIYPTSFPLLNKFSVTPDATFTDVTNGADTHPFASGDQIKYTVQAGDILSANTTYYWRVAGTDPSGSNTYGAWSSTFSFTTAAAGGGSPVQPNGMMTTNTLYWGT